MRVRFFLIVLAATLLAPALVGSTSFANAADTTPIFGPKQFTRGTGAPQTFSETFEHCGTAAAQIVVINGNPDGTNRISNAPISLNGVQILGASDFNQQVASIVKPVVLAEQNQLTIKLASQPGSFLTVAVESVASHVVLSAGGPGVSLLDPATLIAALPIINSGTVLAQNVQLTAITLSGGTLTSPASLPLSVGTIPAGGSAVLNATFSGAFTPLGSYTLNLEGTFAVGDATYCFTLTSDLNVPPAAPGSALLDTLVLPPNQVTGAPFPPQSPDFGDEVNPPHWTVPTAPFAPGAPPPGSTTVTPAPFGDPPAIVFNANNGLGLTSGVSTTAEPSGGVSGGGVVFATVNFRAAFSTDGINFTPLNPTTIFPADAIGFCCDQIVQYIPSVDRFVWLLQGGGFSGYRLATASPATIIASGGTAWTYWNLPAGLFGCSGFDYPDMSLGNSFLYLSWDAFGGGCSSGFQVSRSSFAGIAAGGTITIEFTDPANGTMAWGSHLMQDTGDEIFWAGHINNGFCGLPLPFGLTLCGMRIFSLQEGSNTYFWRDRGISSWANNAPTSLTPDGQDWLCKNFNGCTGNGAFPGNGIIGATRVGSQLWFAWSAGTDSNFPQAHIELVTFDRNNNFSKIQQVQIWNPAYAFAYPALSTNFCTFEVGLSFEFGGGGNYENHVVGFWGDFVAYQTTGSDVGTNRFGDYVSIRRAPPTAADPGNLFAAFGYGLNSVPPPGTGTNVDIHYVLFGRPASSCVIID